MRFSAISRLFSRSGMSVTCAFVVLALAGCEGMNPDSFDPNHGFMDQSETAVTTHGKGPLLVPILNKLNTGIDEPSADFSNASDVKPEDLVATPSDYTVGASDVLTVTINDLQALGTETTVTKRVSESGNVSLPLIGMIPVIGYTESQLEQSIASKYQDAGYLKNATVSVTVTEARGRTFSIRGAVQAAGQYAIPKSDFRILDAITLARDLTVETDPRGARGIEYVYVIRNNAPAAELPTTAPTTGVAPTLAPGAANPAASLAPAPAAAAPAAAPAPAPTEAAATAPTTAAADTEGHYVIVDGKPVLVNGPAGAAAAAAPTTEPSAAPTTQGFAFNDLKEPSDKRIIRVPIGALMNGDLRYNIVIRPDDLISVVAAVQGEYYMGGHFQRVGVYSLSGRMITLKEACVSAGMLDQLAVPARTEITRRVEDNKEVIARVDLQKIFSGQEPDIYLKPDDMVVVGTNAVAPFLAASRGAFRLTYGFGFLYDRNYAPQNNNNNN